MCYVSNVLLDNTLPYFIQHLCRSRAKINNSPIFVFILLFFVQITFSAFVSSYLTERTVRAQIKRSDNGWCIRRHTWWIWQKGVHFFFVPLPHLLSFISYLAKRKNDNNQPCQREFYMSRIVCMCARVPFLGGRVIFPSGSLKRKTKRGTRRVLRGFILSPKSGLSQVFMGYIEWQVASVRQMRKL